MTRRTTDTARAVAGMGCFGTFEAGGLADLVTTCTDLERNFYFLYTLDSLGYWASIVDTLRIPYWQFQF